MDLQLIFMGITGLYISKIFIEVKRRPQYFKDECVGHCMTDETASTFK